MLIKEIRDYSKNVPEKKIILDQLHPHDVARLVLQIAAYAAVDSLRGHPGTEIDEDDIEGFIKNVTEKLDSFNTKEMLSAIKDAEAGKL